MRMNSFYMSFGILFVYLNTSLNHPVFSQFTTNCGIDISDAMFIKGPVDTFTFSVADSAPWSIYVSAIDAAKCIIFNGNLHKTKAFGFDFKNVMRATMGTVMTEPSNNSFSIDCDEDAILITSTTYGINCGATYNNQLNNWKATYNDENACGYTENHGIIGDPAVGCGETYQYEYECVEDSDLYEYVGCYARALPYGPHAYGYNDLFKNLAGPATVTIHCDNYGTLELSTDGGFNFETIATEDAWPTAMTATVDEVTSDTILKITCEDVGVIGGVIATVSYDGNTYSTTEPIEDGLWELMSSSDGVTSPLVYHDKTSAPWSISTSGIASDAKWIWNENVHITMVFGFNFENILRCGPSIGSVPSEASGKSFSIDCGDEEILITAATYGFNCDTSLYNNQLSTLKAACNGENSCDYTVSHGVIGDPAVGCGKTYEYEYECIEGSDDYDYVGCYRDTSTRALPYGPHAYGYNPNSCLRACAE